MTDDTTDPMSASEDTPAKPTEAEGAMAREVARALWAMTNLKPAEKLGETETEDRKAAWEADKGQMVKNARILIRRLQQRGISLHKAAE